MTTRDRLILATFGLIAAVAASWYLLIAPKRQDLAALDIKLGTVQTRVSAAQATLAAARSAESSYPTDYAMVAKLGKAIPADDDVPSLLLQLQSTARSSDVDFQTIVVTGGSPAAATPATAVAGAALPPGVSVGAAGFPTMPFTFGFSGSFFHLEDFLSDVHKYTMVRKDGTLDVRGRLLSVDGFSLKPATAGFPLMQAKLVATAYLLPSDETTAAAAAATAGTVPAATDPAAAAGGATSSTPSASIPETTIR